jgi:hypothetical protein
MMPNCRMMMVVLSSVVTVLALSSCQMSGSRWITGLPGGNNVTVSDHSPSWMSWGGGGGPTPPEGVLGPLVFIDWRRPTYFEQPLRLELPLSEPVSPELLPRMRAVYHGRSSGNGWFTLAEPLEMADEGGSNVTVKTHHLGAYPAKRFDPRNPFNLLSLGVWCVRLLPKPGLDITDAAQTAAHILVFVDGQSEELSDWGGMLEGLKGQLPSDTAVLCMQCPPGNRLADSGRFFLGELNRLAEINPSAQVHVVSDSIGALIARYALESSPGPKAKVASLTMLAPPNHGSGWAEVRQQTSGVRRTAIDDAIARHEGPNGSIFLILWTLYAFRDRVGAAMADLDPKSEFLVALNRDWKAPPEGVQYRIVAGVSTYDWSRVRREGMDEDKERMGELLGDWVVSVASAAMPGLDPLLLPDRYVHLRDSREAADEVLRAFGVTPAGDRVSLLLGHTGAVASVVFSFDGKTIASGGSDDAIRLWDVKTGKCVRTIEAHQKYVRSVAFSPDGKTLISGGSDHTVCVWDVETGKNLRTLVGHTSEVESVAISPDGKTIASGGWPDTIRLWDAGTGNSLRTLAGHQGAVQSIAFGLGGKVLVSGGLDHVVRVWDTATGQTVHLLKGHTAEVQSVAVSPDGKTIASGSFDDTIRLWDAETGRHLQTLQDHDALGPTVAFSPDGKTVASGGSDETIRIWDIASGAPLRTIPAVHRLWCLVLSPDRKTLAYAWDEVVRLRTLGGD